MSGVVATSQFSGGADIDLSHGALGIAPVPHPDDRASVVAALADARSEARLLTGGRP